MKKFTFLLALLSGVAVAETRVSVVAVSHHVKADRKLTEVHPGLAFDYLHDGGYVQVGGYKNSVGRPFLFVAGGIKIQFFRFGILAYDYTRQDGTRHRSLLPHAQIAHRGWYVMFVPKYGEIQPYPTWIATYGWKL